MKNLISTDELFEISRGGDVLIADCRFVLQDREWGESQYKEGHIPGAVYISLDRDLTSPVGQHGGRHPLPPIEQLVELFSSLGVVNGATAVIGYDDGGGPYAARLWWILRYLGHEHVRILDGGYGAFIRSGGLPSKQTPRRDRSVFIPSAQSWMLADLTEVRSAASEGRLVDCRAPERYRGEQETIDAKAGHIPGARNAFWKDNLDEDLYLLPLEQVRDRFRHFGKDAVMYCGSGVTACVNVLAMDEAGYPLPRLYPGSWSDWISYPENPIATGEAA